MEPDPNTVRNRFKRYQQGGLSALGQGAFRGSAYALGEGPLAELSLHPQRYVTKPLRRSRLGGEEHLRRRLHREQDGRLAVSLGLRLQETNVRLGKAEPEAQRRFLAQYEALKRDKGTDYPIYLMEVAHPQHNPMNTCGWIKRGDETEVHTTGRCKNK